MNAYNLQSTPSRGGVKGNVVSSVETPSSGAHTFHVQGNTGGGGEAGKEMKEMNVAFLLSRNVL